MYPRTRTLTLLIAVLVGLVPGPVRGQTVPVDTATLAQGPGARACMLMERTLFKVDVLTLYLRFGPETARALGRLADSGAPRDSLAAVATRSRDAFARLAFLRDVSMNRFLDGVRTDMGRPVEAGWISQATFDEVSASLPRWYAFLESRGVRQGDTMLYRIRGDSLRTLYRSVDGEWLLDQTDVGAPNRLAVMGSYFAPGSSFREGLLDSLLGQDSGC